MASLNNLFGEISFPVFATRYTLNENSFQDDSIAYRFGVSPAISVTRINICRWHFNIAELFLTCNREKR